MFRSNFDDFSGLGHQAAQLKLKTGPDDYVWHPKYNHTFCGALSIVSRQYGWKITRSSFHDFSRLGTTRVGKVENRTRMTQFCTQKIPTLFETQFLSFCDQYDWKMFWSNFDDFFEPEDHQSHESWKSGPDDLVLTAEILTLFGTYFLSFFILMGKKGLWQTFTTFLGPGTARPWKVENWTQISRLSARNRLPLFGVQVLSFRISTAKKCFSRILTTFPGPGTKRRNQSWKPDPDDYVWHPKHNHTFCGAISIASRQYGWKIIRSSFDDFSGLGTTGAGKVGN